MKLAVILAIYFTVSLTSPVARADEQTAALPLCGPYPDQVRLLRERRGEFPVFWGRSAPGVTVRLFTNPTTGSWTILRVLGDRIACVEDKGSGARQAVGL